MFPGDSRANSRWRAQLGPEVPSLPPVIAAAPGERDAHHFIVGARNQPWYQPRIKRLFELRPARVIKGLRCCHRGRVALSDSGPRREIQFEAAVFLLTPRLPNNADWSIQQIFGLSRQETLACVRRGRLVLRERRLLARGY